MSVQWSLHTRTRHHKQLFPNPSFHCFKYHYQENAGKNREEAGEVTLFEISYTDIFYQDNPDVTREETGREAGGAAGYEMRF